MHSYAKHASTMTSSVLAAMSIVGCISGCEGASLSLHPRGIEEVQLAAELSSHDKSRPTLALVLGGGGLRGFAHVGVLSALEDLGVHPDIVVDTSAGAAVGAAYASGLTPVQITAAALNVKISSLIDFTFSTNGLILGNKLAKWVDQLTGEGQIEQFPRRFAAVATDLQSGQAVLLERGSAGSVVQASSAVPGMNIPVPYINGHLIDGGVTSLVPVRFARAMGVDIVIAVDVYCQSPRPNGLNIVLVINQVMRTQSCLLAEMEIAQADIVIAPKLNVPNMASKEAQHFVIQSSYNATSALQDWRGNMASGNMSSF